MKLSNTLLTAGLLLMAGCAGSSNPTGTYLTSDEAGGVMIQMKSAKDDTVSGTFTAALLDERGDVQAGARSFSGTVEGNALNLNIENGTGVSLASGFTTSDGLELTILSNGKSQKLILTKGTTAEFPKIVANLRTRAAELKQVTEEQALAVVQHKALNSAQDRINSVANSISIKAQTVANGVAQIERIVASYAVAATRTDRLRAAQSVATRKLGSDDYRVDQISFAREQNADAARSDHESVQDALERLDAAVVRHETDATAVRQLCIANSSLNCTVLDSALNTYRRHAQEFRLAAAKERTAFARRKLHL